MSSAANDDLMAYLAEVGMRRDWHLIEAKWGKTGASSLLAHSLTVAGLTNTLMDVIDDFSESDRRVGVATSFFHDMLKEGPSSREVIEERGRLLDKVFTKDVKEEITEILMKAGFTSDETEQVLSILPHGSMQGVEHLATLLQKEESKDNPRVRRLVHEVSDVLASKKSVDEFSRLGKLEKSLKDLGLKIEYHKVSVVRGVLTSILHKTMHEIYEDAGFTPILFYPKGTVYVGPIECEIPNKSQFNNLFKNKFWNNLQSFIEETPSSILGSEASGPYTQTKIPSPELAYLSKNSVDALWKRIRNRDTISDPNITNNYDEYIKILKDESINLPEEKEVLEDYLKEIIGLFVIFYYFKEVCTHSTSLEKDWSDKWSDDPALSDLQNAYQNEDYAEEISFEEFINTLEHLSHSGRGAKRKRIEAGLLFRQLFSENLIRKEVLNSAAELCTRFSVILRRFAEDNKGLKSVDIPELLLREVSNPLLSSPSKIVDEVWDGYNKGKLGKGTILCPTCGKAATRNIKGKKVGDGEAKSFTNFLAGGYNLENRRVCDLCDLEMTIRTLHTHSGEFEEYYLIPQINLSPSAADWWSEVAAELVEGHKRFGIDPVTRDLEWATIVDEEGMNVFDGTSRAFQSYTSKLLRGLWGHEKRTVSEAIRKAIDKHIDESSWYDSFEDWSKANHLECESVDEAVDAVLSGETDLIEVIGEDLEDLNKSGVGGLLAMVTPNYVLVSYPLRRRERKDHRANNYLRHLFRGAILSRLFLASVIVKEVKYEPLVDVTSRGAVKIPTNLQFDKVFQNIGLSLRDGWIKMEDLDNVLLKISALLLLAEEVRRVSPSGKSQKGDLTTILRDFPGRTLNRLQQLSTDNTQPNLEKALRLVDRVFAKEVLV